MTASIPITVRPGAGCGRFVGGALSLLMALSLVVAFPGCKCDSPAPEGTGAGAAVAPATPTGPTRPAPAAEPEVAMQALFDALVARDWAAAEDLFLSNDECLAITGHEDRCMQTARQRKEFLEAVKAQPLPDDARIAQMTLLKSFELPKEELKLNTTVRVQPAIVRFLVGDMTHILGSLVAIKFGEGWRVMAGRRPPESAPAGVSAVPVQPVAPPAAGAEIAPSEPPAGDR